MPFLPKRPKFFVPFVWLTSARLAREAGGGLFQPRPTCYLVFCKWYNSNPLLFSETFSSPVPFVRNFFTEISLQNGKRSLGTVCAVKAWSLVMRLCLISRTSVNSTAICNRNCTISCKRVVRLKNSSVQK